MRIPDTILFDKYHLPTTISALMSRHENFGIFQNPDILHAFPNYVERAQ